MAANGLRAGLSHEAALRILDTVTTDEALAVLAEEGRLKDTMREITDRVAYYLEHRAYGRIKTGAVIFSNEQGYLGETESAGELMNLIKTQK